MNLRQAAEQALKYLENNSPDALVQVEPHVWEYKRSLVIQALRKAIEQAEQPESQRHISYVCPNCHWSLDRQPDHLRDATKKVWVGLDYKQMRNTTLQFNYGALWAERYLRKKNNG